jgi:hypothetical protein
MQAISRYALKLSQVKYLLLAISFNASSS